MAQFQSITSLTPDEGHLCSIRSRFHYAEMLADRRRCDPQYASDAVHTEGHRLAICSRAHYAVAVMALWGLRIETAARAGLHDDVLTGESVA